MNSILVERLLHLVPIQISLVSLNIGSYWTFLGCPAVADRYHVHIYNVMSLYIQSHLKSLIGTIDNPNQRTKDLKRSPGVYCDLNLQQNIVNYIKLFTLSVVLHSLGIPLIPPLPKVKRGLRYGCMAL